MMITGVSLIGHLQLNVANHHKGKLTGLHRKETHFSKIRLLTKTQRISISCESREISLIHAESKENRPLVKMCGITSARDAALVAEAGADFIGMILCPNSKRSISLPVAKDISKIARGYGVEPVGIFVDDDADTILRACDAADLEFVQLHGSGSRAAFPILVQRSRVIYVLHANNKGDLLNHISDEDCSLVDWILVDSATGGSGKGFNWSQFKLPPIRSKNWVALGRRN